MKKNEIPKVDEGVKSTDDYESLQSFYSRCKVTEYVHHAKGGKVLKFEFGDIMEGFSDDDPANMSSYAKALSYAEINKKSYYNNIDTSVRYINYFIEYFDPDMELMTNYYYSMFSIMLSKFSFPPEDFIEHLRDNYGTSTMAEKVIAMVEYNTEPSMAKKADSRYDESVQLTDEHLKSIMGISCIHKFIIPIISQYVKARKAELDASQYTEKDLYFQAFTSFIDIFDKYYDINLFNKFYHTATTRIAKRKNETKLWNHRVKDGVSQITLAITLIRDLFIDIAQKVIFSKSAIVFIHVCFDKAVNTELKRKDKHDYSEMEMIGSDNVNETMSKWDSWQQNNPGHSEKDKYRAMSIIRDFLNRACAEVGINRKKDKYIKEYNYYRDHISCLDKTQMNVIFLYFAGRLGSYGVTEYITRDDLNWFIMIMKRELFDHNYLYLPYFITGTLDPINAKKYKKQKIESMISQHPSYQDFLDQYSAAYKLLNEEQIFAVIRSLITNRICVIDYNHQDIEGKAITNIPESTAVDEFMRLYIDL